MQDLSNLLKVLSKILYRIWQVDTVDPGLEYEDAYLSLPTIRLLLDAETVGKHFGILIASMFISQSQLNMHAHIASSKCDGIFGFLNFDQVAESMSSKHVQPRRSSGTC